MRKQNTRRTDNHKLPKHANRIYKYTNANDMYEADVKLEPEYIKLEESKISLDDKFRSLSDEHEILTEKLNQNETDLFNLRIELDKFEKLREGLVEEYLSVLLSQ